MGRLLLSIALLAIFVVGGPAMAQQAPASVAGVTTVDPAAAKVLWDKGVRFIDVRTPNLWEAGRIPGATFLEFFTDYNEENLLKVAATSDEIVVYCMGPG